MVTEKKRLQSHLEFTGFSARHSGGLLDLASLGGYTLFLHRAMRDLELRPGEKVLELGSGPGRRAAWMAGRVGPRGKVTGVEFRPEPACRFRRRARHNPVLELKEQRLEEALLLPEKYDRVFISFVLHGFEQYQRILIIQNAYENLDLEGEFCLLDWGERRLSRSPAWIRSLFRRFECGLAEDFMARDWKTILADYRLTNVREYHYLRGYARLIRCQKY